MTLLDAIRTATGAGYMVRHDEEYSGWVIDTPPRPRRPASVQASYRTERSAWFGAAALAKDELVNSG